MKKGIQYSHYCGTELQELCSYHWLAQNSINKEQYKEAQEFIKIAQDMTEKLRNKIVELDKLNEMNY
jgi:hypothetical protein